jgi:hypothetical protein
MERGQYRAMGKNIRELRGDLGGDAIPPSAKTHRVSARAPRQPSKFSRDHLPIVQVCRILSATQNPAPSLNGRPAQTQPLGGSGTITGIGSNSGPGGSPPRGGVCWAWAEETSRVVIRIVLVSVIIALSLVLIRECGKLMTSRRNRPPLPVASWRRTSGLPPGSA